MTWREVSLKEICKVDWGNTRLTKSSYIDDGKFLAVSAAGADGLINHYEHEANVPVLSAIGAQCGRMFYPGARFTAIKNTITLTPKEGMSDGKFLYYLFTHVELPQRGAGQPFISKGDIEAFRVSIPENMDEQCEMVMKLDKAFAEINSLEGNLGLCDQKATQLFRSILSAPFRDDLTEKLPLGEVAEVIAGQSPEGIYYNTNADGMPFYQGKKEFGEKIIGQPTTWTSKVTKVAEPGDILMSVRAPVGPINFTFNQICIGRGLAAIRASERIDNNYLYYFLLHKQPEISGNTGAVFDSINKEQIASIEIPVPPMQKQHEVVARLEKAFDEVQSLKNQIITRKNSASALLNSLLSATFTEAKEDA